MRQFQFRQGPGKVEFLFDLVDHGGYLILRAGHLVRDRFFDGIELARDCILCGPKLGRQGILDTSCDRSDRVLDGPPFAGS